jgi:hypothetical protein
MKVPQATATAAEAGAAEDDAVMTSICAEGGARLGVAGVGDEDQSGADSAPHVT